MMKAMLNYIVSKMFEGFLQGIGFVTFLALFGIPAALIFTDISLFEIKAKLEDKGLIAAGPEGIPNKFQTTIDKSFTLPQLIPPKEFKRIYVTDNKSLREAFKTAKHNKGNTAIVLASGEYQLREMIYIQHDNIWLLSETGNPYDVVLKGRGMYKAGGVYNLFRVSANHFVVDGLTLSETPNHLIQIAAENNASYPIIRNSILQDAYEQFLKVSYDQNGRPDHLSFGGRVENCIFQYTRGIAPNFYTGGIDALGAVDWVVENNIFKDIASPKKHIAQHAVHFWVNTANNVIRNNVFIDNDRAIGFGMVQSIRKNHTLKYSNNAGLIENNVIFHSDNQDPYADTGIVIEASPNTQITNNTIYLEHDYPRAIEYRFEETKEVLIQGNRVNRSISSRDGGKAHLIENSDELEKEGFLSTFLEHLNRLQIKALNRRMDAPEPQALTEDKAS